MTPEETARFLRYLDPAVDAPGRQVTSLGERVPVRLFGPKVLAAPGQLSAGEYEEAAAQLMGFSMMVRPPAFPPRTVDGHFWVDLGSVAAQARSSQGLLKWGAVEGPVRMGSLPGQ